MRATTGLGIAAGLMSLVLSGCAGSDRSPEAGPAPSPGSDVATPVPDPPTTAYAATLVFAEGDDPFQVQGQSATLILTNTGLGDDHYFLRPIPSSAGQVDPTQVSLAPGESVEVTVAPRAGADLSVTVISAAIEDEIQRLVILG